MVGAICLRQAAQNSLVVGELVLNRLLFGQWPGFTARRTWQQRRLRLFFFFFPGHPLEREHSNYLIF